MKNDNNQLNDNTIENEELEFNEEVDLEDVEGGIINTLAGMLRF